MSKKFEGKIYIVDTNTGEVTVERKVCSRQTFEEAAGELAEMARIVNRVEPEDVWQCFYAEDEIMHPLHWIMNELKEETQ